MSDETGSAAEMTQSMMAIMHTDIRIHTLGCHSPPHMDTQAVMHALPEANMSSSASTSYTALEGPAASTEALLGTSMSMKTAAALSRYSCTYDVQHRCRYLDVVGNSIAC